MGNLLGVAAEDPLKAEAQRELAEGVHQFHLSNRTRQNKHGFLLEASTRFQRALDLFQRTNDESGEARAHCCIGDIREALGDHDAAQVSFRRCLQLAAKIGDTAREAQAHWAMGGALECQKQYAESLQSYVRAFSLFRTMDPSRMLDGVSVAASVQVVSMDIKRTRELLDEVPAAHSGIDDSDLGVGCREVLRPSSDHGMNSDSDIDDFDWNVQERPLGAGCREEHRCMEGIRCLLTWPRTMQADNPPPLPDRRCIIYPNSLPISSFHENPIDISLGRVFADMGFLSVQCDIRAYYRDFKDSDLETMRKFCAFLIKNLAFAPGVPITSVLVYGYGKFANFALACMGDIPEVQGGVFIRWLHLESQPHVRRSCEKGLACSKPKLFVSGERFLREEDDNENILLVQSVVDQCADPKAMCTIPGWNKFDDDQKLAIVFDRITDWINATFPALRTSRTEKCGDEGLNSERSSAHRPSTCASCGATGKCLLCTGCRRVWYCSVACQRRDRRLHRSFCQQDKSKNMSSQCIPSSSKKVVILLFSRNPESFRNALAAAPALQACRDALAENSLSAELPCGAWAFIQPEMYEACMEALSIRNEQLDKRHVLVDPELENVVLKAVKDNVRGKQGVRCKDKSCMPLDFSDAVVKSSEEVVTSRTFIEFKITENSLRSAPSSGPITVSTTDAHGGKNPRAA